LIVSTKHRRSRMIMSERLTDAETDVEDHRQGKRDFDNDFGECTDELRS
jgi:hypothetical protein